MLKGRRSQSSLVLVPLPDHVAILPPDDIPEEAKIIFKEIVESVKPTHWRKCDRYLLTQLAMAILSAKLFHKSGGSFREWMDCNRFILQATTKLRLNPSSRVDSKISERTTRVTGQRPPWEGPFREPAPAIDEDVKDEDET
jgi:hypothetical protein